jgi:catechol 2,3-dioxygenase-like lactoylglutathione lyase family enzyme
MATLTRYPLFQQAYLVNDIEASIAKWNTLFNAGPFVVTHHHKTDRFTYRGTTQEADVSYAFGYLGEQMIQFIQQHDDTPSIYRDMYAAGQEGYHHIAVLVTDFEAEYQRLEAQGYECACRLYADGVDAAYFDTRDVTGGFTEIHGDPPRILAAFAQWRRAHEIYQPGDPAIIQRPPTS